MMLSSIAGSRSENTTADLDDRLRKAQGLSWEKFGKKITAYLPGMFSYDGVKGGYPAISITGSRCELRCDHCKGVLLRSMIHAESPETLVEKALRLDKTGKYGILISGGCDRQGRLPWKEFIPAVREIKDKTGLYVSVHCGILDDRTALDLKEAGVDQALLDVIGDDETYQKVYHVDFGVSRIMDTMNSLKRADLPMAPHIVCGLFYGIIKSEKTALKMVAGFEPGQVVIVSLMNLPGTPFSGAATPGAEDVSDIIVEARMLMPDTLISLGCARKRGDIRTETLAIDAGVNRIALPSEEALSHAEKEGIAIRYQRTCCSVSRDLSGPGW